MMALNSQHLDMDGDQIWPVQLSYRKNRNMLLCSKLIVIKKQCGKLRISDGWMFIFFARSNRIDLRIADHDGFGHQDVISPKADVKKYSYI